MYRTDYTIRREDFLVIDKALNEHSEAWVVADGFEIPKNGVIFLQYLFKERSNMRQYKGRWVKITGVFDDLLRLEPTKYEWADNGAN